MSELSKFGELEDIVRDFLIEAEEMLQILDEDLNTLEASPDDPEILEKIFRVVHTVKGTAGFLGFDDIVEVVHSTENILNKLRHKEISFSELLFEAMLMGLDTVGVLTKNIKTGGHETIDVAPVVSALHGVLDGGVTSVDQFPDSYKKSLVSEVVAEPTEPAEAVSSSSSSAPAAAPPVASPKQEEATTIRVDVNRLETVMNLVGELVLGRNRLVQTGDLLERSFEDSEISAQLSDVTNFIDLVVSDLQLAVMKTRMQQIKKVFSRFPRMVRDLAKSQKKKIKLEVIGEETELDKSVIESIGDPLVHIIRNSCDHGLEGPEERREAGKPEQGTIILHAYYEGNTIIISIKDDGRGINPDRVREKALEKNLITPEESSNISDKEIINYIFKPGFSTAAKVTDISGRGVGMDVVKTNISKLNGVIDLSSVYGEGTHLKITLPLTVAIIQSLMIQVGGEVFGIPHASVVQTVMIDKKMIRTVDQNEVLRFRGEVIPLIRLNELFATDRLDLEREQTFSELLAKNVVSYKKPELPPMPSEFGEENIYIVVLGVGERRLGIIVDSVVGQEEVVLKSLGDYMDVKGLSGATIMGDGSVTLIIDVEELFDISEEMLVQNRQAKEENLNHGCHAEEHELNTFVGMENA